MAGKNYTAHCHDIVHVPTKFQRNTAMRLRVSAKTKRDGHTDRLWPSLRWDIKSYIHQKDYIKMRPEAPGVLAKDSIPNYAIIGNCRIGNGHGRHSLEGPGRG